MSKVMCLNLKLDLETWHLDLEIWKHKNGEKLGRDNPSVVIPTLESA